MVFTSGRRGGVSVFVRTGLSVDVIQDLAISTEAIESMVVRINIDGGQVFNVFALYRPHQSSSEIFTDTLGNMLQNHGRLNGDVYVIGDFNLDILNANSSAVNYFMNTMQSFHYFPLISKPTRFPSNTTEPTLLDHIWCNNFNHYTSGIIPIDVTDHCPIFIVINSNPILSQKNKIEFRVHSERNIENFRRVLSEFDWDFVGNSTDVNQSTDEFITSLNRLYCDSFPIKVKIISDKRLKKPWLSQGILKSIQTKAKYFKLYKMGFISESRNKNFKNRLTSIIRAAKKNYYASRFSTLKNDLKLTWKTINEVLGNNKSKNSVKSLILNNQRITSDVDIANLFNDYFVNVPKELDEKIPATEISALNNCYQSFSSSIFFKPVLECEINEIIKNLKNSKYGLNVIPVNILKNCSDILSGPIAKLVNLSISSGSFPDVLKSATITPIFKKGESTDPSNYRPISVLSSISKIFEKVICQQLKSYIHKFKIINSSQFGFQSGKSTIDALNSLVEKIYNSLNSKSHSVCLFFDLSKAFDTVNHKILLDKLQTYGIRGIALEWFRSFLSSRKQCVRINKCFSNYKYSTGIGLPQGSVLSPIIFLLYINDLPYVSSKLATTLFADDTTFSFSSASYSELVNTVTFELNKISNWFRANRLSVNISKTSASLFSNRYRDVDPNLSISFDGSNVEFVDVSNFLGVRMDNNLTFELHIEVICGKISKLTGIFYKLRNFVPRKYLINLYNTLVLPHLIYCNTIWGGTFPTHTNKILLLQKKLIRIITFSPYLAPTKELFLECKILKINELYNYCVAIHMYKTSSRNELIFQNHSYGTRSNNQVHVPFARLVSTQRSIYHVGPMVWNGLPTDIRESSSLTMFKNKMKIYLLERSSA